VTGQVDQDFSCFFSVLEQMHIWCPNFTFHYIFLVQPSQTYFKNIRLSAASLHTAALQTQNCTVSSCCCPPNTKLHRFVILLPSKHKTAPFRHTAALQTQNCTVSSYCSPPNTKLHRFVILLPSKHKTAPFRHTAVLQTQNCTVSPYCCPPNTKLTPSSQLLPSTLLPTVTSQHLILTSQRFALFPAYLYQKDDRALSGKSTVSFSVFPL
jgi:hypothetical protein